MKTGNKGDGAGADKSIPCRERLKGGLPGKRFTVDTLSLQSGMETNITKAKRRPRYESSNRSQTLQPSERLGRATFS